MSNAASAKQASRQMDFQRDMANTAHQREVTDLRAAGLNPILSASKGLGGAATPSGASAQQTDMVSPAVNSAMNAYRTDQEVENLKKANQLQDAQIDTQRSQAELNRSQIPVNSVTAQNLAAETPNIPIKGNLMQNQAFAAAGQGLANASQDVLNMAQAELAKKNIELSQANIRAIAQVIAKGLGDVQEARIVAGLLQTDVGEAAFKVQRLKEALPSLSNLTPLLKKGGGINIFNNMPGSKP